jgi:ribosomal protein S12 methylthiotransferase
LPKIKDISIITLGCSKNTVDSEVLAGRLYKSGIRVHFEFPGKSDVVIVNTCGFIGDAKQESIDTILAFLELKEQGLVRRLFVMGCLIQRYARELQAELPGVDGFFGVSDLEKIIQSLSSDIPGTPVEYRFLSTPSHYAWLKISEGCDRKCSFCAIPSIRGKNTSRSMESLLEEAALLSQQGVKEINIIAQDTTAYGLDLYGKRSLASLLDRIASARLFEWIRLHYTFPAGFPAEVLEVMAAYPEICKYVDIPLQHISERILRSMKRGMYKSGTEKLLDTIRTKVPGVSIRTAFIVGYPGETRAEFNELLRFIRQQRFERAGVFTYSHEEGTAAGKLTDNISEKTRQSRAAELMMVQQEISEEINLTKIGSSIKAIIDRKEGDHWIGRSEHDSPEIDNEVIITSPRKLKPGDICTVKITDAAEFDLTGIVE